MRKIYARSTMLHNVAFILTGCKSSVPENTVFPLMTYPARKSVYSLELQGDTLVSDYEEDGSGTVVERYNKR